MLGDNERVLFREMKEALEYCAKCLHKLDDNGFIQTFDEDSEGDCYNLQLLSRGAIEEAQTVLREYYKINPEV